MVKSQLWPAAGPMPLRSYWPSLLTTTLTPLIQQHRGVVGVITISYKGYFVICHQLCSVLFEIVVPYSRHIRRNWNSSHLEHSLLSLQSALLQSTHSLSQCFVSDIILDTKMAITATALYDERNWESYLKSFRNTFKYLDAELTDPNKFPKGKIRILFYLLPQNVFNLFSPDSRDGNGFWMPYRVHAVWGYFSCPEDDSCSWESKEIQIDVMVSLECIPCHVCYVMICFIFIVSY